MLPMVSRSKEMTGTGSPPAVKMVLIMEPNLLIVLLLVRRFDKPSFVGSALPEESTVDGGLRQAGFEDNHDSENEGVGQSGIGSIRSASHHPAPQETPPIPSNSQGPYSCDGSHARRVQQSVVARGSSLLPLALMTDPSLLSHLKGLRSRK